MSFFIRPRAQRDLTELLEYIAKDNHVAIYRVRDAIMQTCELRKPCKTINSTIISTILQK